MIRGVSVQLKIKTLQGKDGFNKDIYTTSNVTVENVLVGEPSQDDIVEAKELYGKKATYTLGIPKTDTNDWTDTEVILPEPFAGTYKTIGFPTAGISDNIPGPWNKKVKVERYG